MGIAFSKKIILLEFKENIKKNTINLGYGGNGPIRSLAALQEYVDLINVKNILWMYYEGNDAQNYIYEKKN